MLIKMQSSENGDTPIFSFFLDKPEPSMLLFLIFNGLMRHSQVMKLEILGHSYL